MRWQSPAEVRALLAGAVVTYTGDEVAAVALGLTVQARGGSGTVVSLLLVARMLPLVLLGPWAGAVVDRTPPRTVLAAASLAGAVVSAVLIACTALPLWLVGAALLAATAAFAQPALMTLLPECAGPDASRRALALAAVASRSSSATGALLAGGLVGLGGLRFALAADAVSYCALHLAVVLVARPEQFPYPSHRRGVPSQDGPGAPRLSGLRAIGADPVLSALLAGLLLAFTFVGISYVAVFFLLPAAGHGWTTAVIAAYALGMTAGCWLAGRLAENRLATVVAWCPVVLGGCFLLPVLASQAALAVPAAVTGFGGAGLAAGAALTALRGLVLLRVPADVLGRVWATEMALGVTSELVALGAAGVLVDAVGARAALGVCGAGALLTGIGCVLALRRTRTPGRAPAGTTSSATASSSSTSSSSTSSTTGSATGSTSSAATAACPGSGVALPVPRPAGDAASAAVPAS